MEDLIIDCAEVTCDVEVVDADSMKRIYKVSAYPTTKTRELTKNLRSTLNDLKQIAAQCRWETPGIVKFFIHPSNQTVVKAQPLLGYIEISIQTLLDDYHKGQLAEEAKKQYWSLPVTAQNFTICRFGTFIAELHISVQGTKRKFLGMLPDSQLVHPFRVQFEISDEKDLEEVDRQLRKPNENEFTLRYYYTLIGSLASHTNLTITADQVTECQLENEIFGDSKADSMIVSRYYMEKMGTTMLSKLKILETIGVGANPLNHDLVKQAIIDSITSGFKKWSMEELQEQLNQSTTLISDDLKANIVRSQHESQDHNDHSRKETAHERKTSDLNETNDQQIRSQHNIQETSQSGEGSATGSAFGCTADLKGKCQKDTTTDSSTSDDVSNNTKRDEHHTTSNKDMDDVKRTRVHSRTIAGTKVDAKTIDAAVVDRRRIKNGFVVILDRWVHQMASKYVTGCLSNDDIRLVTSEQNSETSERKPRGFFYGIRKSDPHAAAINSQSDVNIHDVFNILIVGRSRVGKSTIINLIHNYFLNSPINQLERITDAFRKRSDQSMISATDECVRYIYRSKDSYIYQIIDSPGLAATSDHEKDEKSIELIIRAAQCVKHINCILFVCNGTDNTSLLDIRTTFVLLKNNLPTTVLDNVMAFFTFTADFSANRFDLRKILRLEDNLCLTDVDKMSKYYADSSFFVPMDPSLPPDARKAKQICDEAHYESACVQIDMLLAQVRRMRSVSSDPFSAVIESRNCIMADIAQLQIQLNMIAELVNKLDTAKGISFNPDSHAEANKAEVDAIITNYEDQKKIISDAFGKGLGRLLEQCRDMKQKVKGFNLIAYINVVLEVLGKNIKNTSHRGRRAAAERKVVS